MSIFSKKRKEASTANTLVDALISGRGGRCPYCGVELQPIVDRQAQPVYDVFRRMGSVAAMVTFDHARDQIIKQGITCSCGKEIHSLK